MQPEVIAAIIGGFFLLASTTASIVSAILTQRTSSSVSRRSKELSRSIESSTRVTFVEGERESHEVLTRLTLNESLRINVTRFSPKSVTRQVRYVAAIKAKLIGTQFEDEHYGRLEKYNRLTSLNSDENKESLLNMLDDYVKSGCDNFTLRITADKNDFELLVFEKSKIAALCFHDLSKQDVVHSCIIVSDRDMYVNFYRLYQKLWNEDILLEVDFSKGIEHVNEQIEKLKKLEPITKNDGLSPIDSMIYESNLKIKAAELASK